MKKLGTLIPILKRIRGNGSWIVVFILMSCAPIPKRQETQQEFYRVRRCYEKQCDQLRRYGSTAIRPQKLKPLERCSKKNCERFNEYGPNGLTILRDLKRRNGNH